jgi:hypothetical protein
VLLAGAKQTLELPTPEGSMNQQRYATFVVTLLLDEHGEVRRTKITHVQTGAEEVWAGWAEERLLIFIVTHRDRSLPE